ncbi:TRAP transporter small permease [Amphritea sp. HPY]|uniref:TRAP transporter small permease n=1 Tax=Amphritea sp. HPY TaxID=3421652 RepID=UPI003D7CB638
MYLKTFIASIRALSIASGLISASLVAASVLVVCQMVIVRYVFGESTIWQTDFITYGLASSAFLGAPYVAQLKGHVNVDLLTMYSPPKFKRILAYITIALALLFSLLFSYTGWELWYEAWEGQWTTESIWELPLWIPYLSLPIGMTLLALEYLVDAICLFTDGAVPFGTEPGGHS